MSRTMFRAVGADIIRQKLILFMEDEFQKKKKQHFKEVLQWVFFIKEGCLFCREK